MLGVHLGANLRGGSRLRRRGRTRQGEQPSELRGAVHLSMSATAKDNKSWFGESGRAHSTTTYEEFSGEEASLEM
jgi:hypothetical protein